MELNMFELKISKNDMIKEISMNDRDVHIIIPKQFPLTTNISVNTEFTFTRYDPSHASWDFQITDEKNTISSSGIYKWDVEIPVERKTIHYNCTHVFSNFVFPHAGNYKVILDYGTNKEEEIEISVEPLY